MTVLDYFVWASVVFLTPYACYLMLKTANAFRIDNKGLTLLNIFCLILLFISTILPFYNFLLISLLIVTLEEEKIEFFNIKKLGKIQLMKTKFFKPD